jgi:hypothetical protein
MGKWADYSLVKNKLFSESNAIQFVIHYKVVVGIRVTAPFPFKQITENHTMPHLIFPNKK